MDVKVKKWYQMVKGVRSHSVLNFLPFRKVEVKDLIAAELGWKDYGGKHHESIFTRFYQGYILPRKFGVDKRKAHLSNLIYSGQISKNEALLELAEPPLAEELVRSDLPYVIKKLGLSTVQFEQIMRTPPRSHQEFDVEKSVYEMYPYLKPFRGAANQLKKVLR